MQLLNTLAKSKLCISLLGLAFISAGCSRGVAQPRITLTFWKTFEDSGALQPLIQDYERLHPNVTIQYTKKNINNYEADLLDALASDAGPDIFSINNTWLPKYLNKIAPDSKAFTYKDYKDTFVDAVVADFTQNNKIYGTALAVDSLGLYYNKDLLGTAGIATPPKTWEELQRDVRKLKRQDQTGYFAVSGAALGTAKNINRPVDILQLFMLQKGLQPWSADGLSPRFTQSIQNGSNVSRPGVEGLAFYTSFADPDSQNYNWNSRSDYSIDAFANGRAAFLFSYPYTRQTLLQKSPNLNFDVAGVPQPNLDDPSVNFANYWGEVVNKKSKNQNWAWDFLKFITSKKSLDTYYTKHKQASSRKDSIELQIQDPEIGVFAHANLTAKTFYKPDQAQMDTIFTNLIDAVILNGVKPEEALSQAQNQAATLTRNFN